jgi:transcriptional antiterminator Rof (Rho-off)
MDAYKQRVTTLKKQLKEAERMAANAKKVIEKKKKATKKTTTAGADLVKRLDHLEKLILASKDKPAVTK